MKAKCSEASALNRNDVHRQIRMDEVEQTLETLVDRFIKSNNRSEDIEARLLYVSYRCVKTVIDLLRLPADKELLLKWKESGYRTGWTVEDSARRMVARSGYDGTKHVSHIAKTHEIWRKAVREFGGIE